MIGNLTKSFYMLGDSLDKCLPCAYCRVCYIKHGKISNHIIPTDINENFRNIPVAVNLFYGDPFIQTDNTLQSAKALEVAEHKGPVVIITKAPIKKIKEFAKLNLDLHICVSTFGCDHRMDGGSTHTFESNLEILNDNGIKTSIEFRPLIHKVNDDDECLEYVFEKASLYNIPVGYSAIQAKPETLEELKCNGFNIEPFPGKTFHSHLKPIDSATDKRFREVANDYGVNVFRKTSCLISYQHNKERDFNAHYYRVNDVSCWECPMKDKCSSFKEGMGQHTVDLAAKVLPFAHTVEYKTSHSCGMVGSCLSETAACHDISGYFLEPECQIVRGDARMIKWLTGLIVDGDIKDGDYLSDFWKTS